MTVQVGEISDLHRFLFFPKGGLHMPEQSVLHQESTESDQQTIYLKINGAAVLHYGIRRTDPRHRGADENRPNAGYP